MNIVKIVDKVDKKVENLTRGRWIPIDSMKSWNYFRNYGHKIGGMGYIDSDKTNPAPVSYTHLTLPTIYSV